MINEDELRTLCQQEPPLSLAQIGQHFGVTRQRIHQILTEMNISKPSAAPSAQVNICPDCQRPIRPESKHCRVCAAKYRPTGRDYVVKGYLVLPYRLRRKYQLLFRHQLIAMQKIGRPLRDGEEVHHIDGNRLNNHPDNLMVVTRNEHVTFHKRTGTWGGMRYRRRSRPSKAGYIGVAQSKAVTRVRYEARCRGKHLGTFDTPEEAAAAYNREAVRLYGASAPLNNIGG